MMNFHNFDEVLDFAILQEQAAQQFYTAMSGRVHDPAVAEFYRILVAEEREHENRLQALKGNPSTLRPPDLEDLAESGYLKAIPIPPDITFKEAVKLAIQKEKSAHQLYSVLADMIDQENLEQLFRDLACQEIEHMKYFQKEFEAIQLAES